MKKKKKKKRETKGRSEIINEERRWEKKEKKGEAKEEAGKRGRGEGRVLSPFLRRERRGLPSLQQTALRRAWKLLSFFFFFFLRNFLVESGETAERMEKNP
jgi:hypothetical protein